MNQPERKAQPDHGKRAADVDSKSDGKPEHTLSQRSVINTPKPVGPDSASQKPQGGTSNENRNGSYKLREWIRRTTITDWLLVLLGAVAGIIAWRQNELIYKSNEIAESATAAAVAAKDIAEKALQVSEDGAETDRQTAQALKDTSLATQRTADATKSVATENAKTVVETRKIATIADHSLGVSVAAAESAERSAQAAEVNADTAKSTLNLAANTTKKQLRAYVSVVGTDLRYEQSINSMVAIIALENTGLTPANDIVFKRNVECTIPPAAPPKQGEEPVGESPTSLGPRGRFQVTLIWSLANRPPPEMLDSREMEMWVFGQVAYKDVFGDDCQTDFYFTQGAPTVKGRQWPLVYAPFGNIMK